MTLFSLKQYEKHIFKVQTRFFFLATLSFSAIVILTQFIKLINKYIGKGISVAEVLYMIALFLPSLLVYLIPITLFISIIFSYHKLSVDNELVALESAGISKRKISNVFFKFSLLLTVISLFLTFYINPNFKKAFNSKRLMSNQSYISEILEEKVFNNLTKNLTIFVNSKNANGELSGVLIYDNTPGKNYFISAEKATFGGHNNMIVIFLENGTKQEIENGELNILRFEKSKLNLTQNQTNKQTIPDSEEEMSIFKLISSIMHKNIEPSLFRVELQKRIAWPLMNLAIAATSIFAMTQTKYSRKWSPKQILTASALSGVLIFLYFLTVQLSNKSLLMYGLTYLNPLIWVVILRKLIHQTSENTDATFNVSKPLSRKKIS